MVKLPRPILTLALLAMAGAAASAQQSPYVGLEGREIKALSADAIEQYRAGDGMGLALAAELNGYPGPKHVLELAEELGLTPDQLAAVQRSFDSMHERAVALGHRLIELEAEIDGLFASGKARPEELRAALDALGAVQAELRFEHLEAHLETKGILTRHQAVRYVELRGYSGTGPHQHHSGHHSGRR